jgi:hypothetical protein
MPLIVLILLILILVGGIGYPFFAPLHHAAYGYGGQGIFLVLLVALLLYYFAGPWTRRL